MRKLLHRGLHYRRTKYKFPDGRINLEKVFADEWEKENKPEPAINFGFGILQDLMVTDSWSTWPTKIAFIISKRDACIVAEVVQWLGSNCGFCFLNTCLNKAGYRIEKIEKDNG